LLHKNTTLAGYPLSGPDRPRGDHIKWAECPTGWSGKCRGYWRAVV
jgi:hypothetical protein